MPEIQVGRVTHYFDRIGVAVLDLEDTIRVGDTIHFRGHSSDFSQTVESMQIDHKAMDEAKPGHDVALRVTQKVHEHDKVFKVTPET